jgi:hypothetical protein
MNLVAMSIPDDPAALPAWLERHLVGLDLGALAAELTAVHGAAAGPPLAEILGGQRKAVLEGGLAALSPPALAQLLRHPRRLLELQELVLTEGGPYWQRYADADAALAALALRGEQRLAAGLPGPRPAVVRPRFGWFRAVAVGLSAAAATLLAVFLFRGPLARQVLGPPVAVATPTWGWEKLQSPPPNESAPDYLNGLADAAEEWFRQRPDTAPALAQRIGELRLGCSRLIFAAHAPLTDVEERKWLVAKCRSWAAKFDKSLTELEGGRPVGEVRDEMDRTVRRVAATLRERAQLLKAAG